MVDNTDSLEHTLEGEACQAPLLPLATNNEGKSKISLKGKAKFVPSNPQGRPSFNDLAHNDYNAKPLATKAEILRNQWASIAHIVLGQAEKFSRSVSKKDYGRLMQLLSSAGIAYDKVVPKGEHIGGNITFNLFKGLPTDKLAKVIGNDLNVADLDVKPSSIQ